MADERSERILIVDDDPGMRELLAVALRAAGYETEECATAEDALDRLRRERFSLVLLDNRLPGMSGVELIERLRRDPSTQTLPVILVAAGAEADRQAAGLRSGADDYMAKPVRILELVARVGSQLRRRDAWMEAIREEQSRRMAVAGALSALEGERRPRQLAEAICSAIGEPHGAALLAVTPDRSVLLLGARGLALPADAELPLPEEVASYVLARAEAGPWIERADAGEAGLGPAPLACAPIHLGRALHGLLLVGIDPAAPDHPDAAARTLAAAIDYAAIAANLVGALIPGLGSASLARLRIEVAIRERAFRPVFQPIVDLDRGVPVGFEALTRFDSGERPDAVFAEAHAVGLGIELELATLAAIFAEAVHLPAGAFVSVNVSPALVVRRELAALVERESRAVVLELTEHDRIDDYGSVRDALRRMGPRVQLSVDDAGAGFASLSHVLELEPHYVKLDRSWVAGIDHDPSRQALVAGLGHFSDRFGCAMIAEGIETEAERDMLRELAAPLGQGFLFGFWSQ